MKRTYLPYTVPLLLVLLLFLPASLSAEWTELPVLPDESVWDSSHLTETIRGKEVVYSTANLFDNDSSTPWVEGAPGFGIGETIIIRTDDSVEQISFINGFAKSVSLFAKNGRIKDLRLSVAAAFTAPGLVSETDHQLYFLTEYEDTPVLTLSDTREEQEFPFPISAEAQDTFWYDALEQFKTDYPFFYEEVLADLGLTAEADLILAVYSMLCIKLTILDVYPGSLYEDTCLSEIELMF